MNMFITVLLFVLPSFLLLIRRAGSSKRLPPGSLGLPIVGQSLSFLRAMRANKAEKWLEERISKYGPISKLSLFGKPTVFIYGQAANKFIFTNSNGQKLSNAQPKSLTQVIGHRNILEMIGDDHKRLRDALMMFLKPDSLKQYVGKMDGEIRDHLETNWRGKEKVIVMPSMKTLTFNILCTLLFGLRRGGCRDKLLNYYQNMLDGLWSVPINVPFTRYNRSIRSSKIAKEMIKDLIREKREELKTNEKAIHHDLITSLLSIRKKDGSEAISEEEIVHNVMIVMFAGHDTSSILLTFLVRLLASDPIVHASVLREQEEIAKNKAAGEHLTWEDLTKMKYTWRVALETLRLIPPIFGNFRKAMTDIEYGGYLIPKGWQVFWASYMTHMDDSIFHEPSKFDPRRFENQALVPPYTFLAFGAGPRDCPGYEFARIETLITIHYMVTQFTWRLCHADNAFIRDPIPIPTEGLPILIEPRNIYN